MDLLWIPVTKHWRLNERHYGALQGLDKAETAAKHGEDQVKIWRRSYDIPPPPLSPEDERHSGRDPRYANLTPAEVPASESLKDTVARFLPYWHDTIAPVVRSGRRVLIAAHGNSLRALVIILMTSRIGHRRAETSRPGFRWCELDEAGSRFGTTTLAIRLRPPPAARNQSDEGYACAPSRRRAS